MAASLAAAACAGVGAAQVVVDVAPAGVSVRVPGGMGASGAAAPSNPAMVLPSLDFARNVSFQLDRIAPTPTAAASAPAAAAALPAQLQGALQAQVLAGVPQSQAVATQNVLVQALADPRVLAAIQDDLRRTAVPGDPALGRRAAEKLSDLAAAAQDEKARAALDGYAGELHGALAAALAGDDRAFARLFDGLLSGGSGAAAVDARDVAPKDPPASARLGKATARPYSVPKETVPAPAANASAAASERTESSLGRFWRGLWNRTAPAAAAEKRSAPIPAPAPAPAADLPSPVSAADMAALKQFFSYSVPAEAVVRQSLASLRPLDMDDPAVASHVGDVVRSAADQTMLEIRRKLDPRSPFAGDAQGLENAGTKLAIIVNTKLRALLTAAQRRAAAGLLAQLRDRPGSFSRAHRRAVAVAVRTVAGEARAPVPLRISRDAPSPDDAAIDAAEIRAGLERLPRERLGIRYELAEIAGVTDADDRYWTALARRLGGAAAGRPAAVSFVDGLASSPAGPLDPDGPVDEFELRRGPSGRMTLTVLERSVESLSGEPLRPASAATASHAAVAAGEAGLRSAMGELASGGASPWDESHANMGKLLRAALRADPELPLDQAKVLLVERRAAEGGRAEPDLALLRVKDSGARTLRWHFVLAYDGKIFDPAFAGEAGLPARAYFSEMFVRDPDRAIRVTMADASPPLLERIAGQIERWADRQPLGALDVRVLGAADFLNRYEEQVQRSRGIKDLKNAPENLASFLALPVVAAAGPAAAETAFAAGDAEVSFDPERVEGGSVRQVAGALSVRRRGEEFPVNYNRTDRGLENLQRDFYPKSMLDVESLRGKIVLDATAGGGLFVEELRLQGVAAYGMDIVLDGRQQKRLLSDTREMTDNAVRLAPSVDSQPFLWGDALNTHLADASVDAVYDTYGLVEYNLGRNGNRSIERAFREWKRILRAGGVMRFSPVSESDRSAIQAILDRVGGLKLTGFAPAASGGDFRAVEITKL